MEELERFYKSMAHFRKRPGMYVGKVSYEKIVAYIHGYDHSSCYRDSKGILDGFYEWVSIVADHSCSCGWPWIILNIIAGKDEERAIDCFFDIFADYYHAVRSEGVESIKARAKKMEKERWAKESEEGEEEYEDDIHRVIESDEEKLNRIKSFIDDYMNGS